MYEATFPSGKTFEIKLEDGQTLINGKESETDVVSTGEGSWHVIHKGHSMEVSLVNINRDEKTVRLSIKGKKVTVSISTEMDKLLKKMGLSAMTTIKATEVKAPMPGLIHAIEVSVGDLVSKGDALLILEAMKMENIIKAPADGTVKSINIETGETVDKGTVMIAFE